MQKGHIIDALMNIKTGIHITLVALLFTFAASPASAQTSTVVPHLLDGTNYRTIVYIQNFSTTTPEPYLFNMMNEDGTAALFHVAEVSGVTGSLSGTLQPLAVAIFHTNGGAALPPQGQVGWAKLDPFNTGLDVSVWVIIESQDPKTLNWTTQSRIASIPMVVSNSIPVDIPFDQTNGIICGVAAVNLFPTTAYLTADVFDVNGVLVGSLQYMLLPFSHYQKVLSTELPATAGIAGTLRLRPTNSADVLTLAVMGVKVTNYTVGWTQTSLPVAYLGTLH
jgi:hypothetical protein